MPVLAAVVALGLGGAAGIARTVGAAAPGGETVAAAVPARLVEFLVWAHPPEERCAPPRGIEILDRRDGTLRAHYTIACDGAARDLEGVFRIREGDGVWQVAAGYETGTDAPAGAAGVASRPEGLSAQAGSPAATGSSPPTGTGPRPVQRLKPPPEVVPVTGEEGDPLAAARPPRVLKEIRPDYPEEAGRARLIGAAVVELLVEVSPEGRPLRTRPLRGPDPDLGMRQAAAAAVRDWRFEAATLHGRGVRYFMPVEITFPGLPRESRDWMHRALFRVEAVVSTDAAPVEQALERVQAGEPFLEVAAGLPPEQASGGDWGLVSASSLPAPVRRALHEARVDAPTGPVAAEGVHYLLRKRGEIYYAILPARDGEPPYRILHRRNPPPEDALRAAIESDVQRFLAEDRRQAYMNEAARLMGIHQVRVRAGQLIIHTDALDESEVHLLGRVVESLFRAHEDLWEKVVPLRPFEQEVWVFALARNADHDRLNRLWDTGGQAARGPGVTAGEDRTPAGRYMPASRILSIACEGSGGHVPVPALVHEAVHMLNYERVYVAGARGSPWFEEGMATYFGGSQVDGRLAMAPGTIRRSGMIVADTARLEFDPRAQLLAYRRTREEQGPVPLRTLIAAGPDAPPWRGPGAGLAYGASWTLVHFLLHGEKGRHRGPFLEYAALEARGEGGPEAFARLLGPLEVLEPAWHHYEEQL